ncbi:MAG: hypothetical protein E3J46_09830 [Desulfobacteraceae bacterium]|nr:MAG: hypothetical protein E3J46_09830 [Desulfobacteraceae bacterium]
MKEFEHKGLFEDVEFVWEALVRLKSYMKETLTPNVAPLSGDMLSKTCVLWGGNIGDQYVCKDGPVFSLAKLKQMPPEY